MTIDAVVIGSGPNGLAAAITLAQKGLSVTIIEAKETVGGGMRTKELLLSGCFHDVCSAVHPLAVASPFFKKLDLAQYGLEWIYPKIALAHPLQNETAFLYPSLKQTAEGLGRDRNSYLDIFSPFSTQAEKLLKDILSPLHFPKHPFLIAKFASDALFSASFFSKIHFKEKMTKTFFLGLAAHSMLDLQSPISAAFGIILALLAHEFNWPIPKGGSQQIANALASYFQSLGGKIVLNTEIRDFKEIPSAKTILCDITPKQFLKIFDSKLDSSYKRKLDRFRYGPGVFKIDWILNEPIPWNDSKCKEAATIHIGDSIENSEAQVWKGKTPEKPFIILSQPTLFDPSRALTKKHIAWAYTHVPSHSTYDMTHLIESEIENVAKGFRDCIQKRHILNSQDLESYNPNYVGGDINGGVQDMCQLFKRPTSFFSPYSTPLKNVFFCSSSTPPGGGVHGMCGYHAAQDVLKKFF